MTCVAGKANFTLAKSTVVTRLKSSGDSIGCATKGLIVVGLVIVTVSVIVKCQAVIPSLLAFRSAALEVISSSNPSSRLRSVRTKLTSSTAVYLIVIFFSFKYYVLACSYSLKK